MDDWFEEDEEIYTHSRDHAQGGGIWTDGAGMPDPAASAPPTNSAPEPTNGRGHGPAPAAGLDR